MLFENREAHVNGGNSFHVIIPENEITHSDIPHLAILCLP